MKIFKIYKAHLMMSLLSFIAVSCVKESSIGSDILPDEDKMNVNSVDTFTLHAHIMELDTIPTFFLSSFMFGEINDVDFGVTSAKIFTQFNLSGNNFSFGENQGNLVLDSVILNLKYSSTYGLAGYEHNIEVYELEQDLSDTVSYYSNSEIAYSELIGSVNLIPNEELIFEGPDGEEEGIISIKLSESFAQNLFNANPDIDFVSNESFQNFFKGVCIQSASEPGVNDGSIVKISINNPESRMLVYYSDTSVETEDSLLTAEFPISTSAVTFNNIVNDRSQILAIEQQVQDTTQNYDFYYLQASHGIKLRVRFPYVSALRDLENLGIAYAGLVIPINRYSDEFANPSELIVSNYSSALIPTSTYQDSSYVLDVTRYLQQYKYGEIESNYVDVIVKDYINQVSRTVVNGAINPDKPIKLEVVFTEF